jgi:hypothetical protein
MTTVKLAAAVVSVALALAGCDSQPDPPAPVVVRAHNCPTTHPTPLVLYPETQEEASIVSTLIACTNGDGSSTYFENLHESAVWTIDRPTDVRWTVLDSDLKLDVFHEVIQANRLDGMTLEPGRYATIDRPPAEVHLSLNPSAQAAWQTLSLLADTAQDKIKGAAQDGLKRLLRKGSPSRNATVDCLFEGFSMGQQVVKAGESRSPEDVLESGLGIFDNAKTCAKSINQAARSEGVITIEDIARETKSSAWRTTTRTMLNTLKIAKGIRIPTRL